MNVERLNRITEEADKCGGRPLMRAQWIRVLDVLELLGAEASFEEIPADYPFFRHPPMRLGSGGVYQERHDVSCP